MATLPKLYGVSKNGSIKEWSVWVEGDTITVIHGQLGGKMQMKKTVCKPKNVGRSNATTAEQQAVLEAISKHKKQQDKNYRETIEEAKKAENSLILPMLASDFTKVGHSIQFPCYVSPKLDGLRCIAVVNDSKVVFHSRGGKTYPVPNHLAESILELSEATGINVFDGELYIHGLSLQNITSCAKKHNENTPNLQYWIFDLPSDKIWEERLGDLAHVQEVNKSDSVKIVANLEVQDRDYAQKVLGKYLEQGFEGIMLRNINGKYEANHRSRDLQKWKLFQDTEAKVFAVEKDKNGEGVLHCELLNGVVFKCKMKGSHESRLYENQLKMLSKWVVVKFQTLTDDGVPQFPVGICERECDDKGNPLV